MLSYPDSRATLTRIIHRYGRRAQLVYFHQVLISYAVGIGIEVEEVAEDIPGGVADLAVDCPTAA